MYSCVVFKDRQTDRQTDKQTDSRQTYRQPDRQTARQTYNWLGGRKEGKCVNGRIHGWIDEWIKERETDDCRTCRTSANCTYYFPFQNTINICKYIQISIRWVFSVAYVIIHNLHLWTVLLLINLNGRYRYQMKLCYTPIQISENYF